MHTNAARRGAKEWEEACVGVGVGVGANDTEVLANGVHKLRTKPVIEGGGPQGVGVWESAQRWAGRSVLK